MAISGACSDHDGVNCSAGADWDNSVICNDEWKDSSVNYWASTECRDYWCNAQTDLYESLFSKLESEGTFDIGTSEICEELGLDGYSTLDICLELREKELESIYQSLIDTVSSYRYICWEGNYCLPNAILDKDKNCNCVDGYVLSNDNLACITPSESCQELYGENSYSDEIKQDNGSYNCYCEEGYYFDNNTQCILNVINTTEENSNKAEKSPFYDITTSNKNYKAIEWLYNNNIISGYPDGSFKPDNTINRAELLTLLVRTTSAAEDLNYAGASVETPPPCFSDVDVNTWYNAYVCTAKKYGWVEGYDNNTFKPEQPVTKAEAIKMLLITHNINVANVTYNSAFEDVKTTDWYAPYLQIAKDKGILEETGEYYGPNNDMTRGNISESLYRLMNQ